MGDAGVSCPNHCKSNGRVVSITSLRGDEKGPGSSLRVGVGAIVEKVGSFYEVSGARIIERGHPPHPGTQVAMYLTRKNTDLSLKEIGAIFGERHYTAVSVAFRRVEARRQRDRRLDRELHRIERDIC